MHCQALFRMALCRVNIRTLASVAAAPAKTPVPEEETPALEEFLDHWYPIQVKQKDRVGRPGKTRFSRR